MATAKKKASVQKRADFAPAAAMHANGETIRLEYNLAELPNSQHRAGLAGLVLMVRYVQRAKPQGVLTCEVSETGATLSLNRAGLKALLDETYRATFEPQESSQLWKNKSGEIKQPFRTVEKVETDKKTGKQKKKTVYIYNTVVPHGAFLADPEYNPSGDDKKGVWIKLWRDMLWSILRGVPATRNPYQARADKEESKDIDEIWELLNRPAGKDVVKLPSTYFLGAQESSAEQIPFLDRGRFQFLLHFWPFVAQIYVPAVVDLEGKREFKGYAIVIPDIANLEQFCEDFRRVLRERGPELSGYRPRDCVIDLFEEGAYDALRRLSEEVGKQETQLADLLLGVDVIHCEKQGKNVRILVSARVNPPEQTVLDELFHLRRDLWDHGFRRMRLKNAMQRRPWYAGFDRLIAVTSYDRTIATEYFRHDARLSFNEQIEVSKMTDVQEKKDPRSAEALVYGQVRAYIYGKLGSKYGLEWKKIEGTDAEGKYSEYRHKIARDAFLAVRSRTGADFISYFASTFGSVFHHVSQADYEELTRQLYSETEKMRTLTLLALSAMG